jgi:hypothetical protein
MLSTLFPKTSEQVRLSLNTQGVPLLPLTVLSVPRQKTATARIQDAAILIKVPQKWSRLDQQTIARQLALKLQIQFNQDWELVEHYTGTTLSFEDKLMLEQWVVDLNRKTLQVSLKAVRIGHSRYTRLAQMNLKNRVMTVSRYCVDRVPESALAYLALHELAHLQVPNHSRTFWEVLRPFVPNLRYQRRLIQAVHRVRLFETASC